jgi:hypothetical protein
MRSLSRAATTAARFELSGKVHQTLGHHVATGTKSSNSVLNLFISTSRGHLPLWSPMWEPGR